MPTASTRKANPLTVDPSAPEKRKTRASWKKAEKNDNAPSELVDGGTPPMVPATIPTAPKKRGRKPKLVASGAEVGNAPSTEVANVAGPETVNQPASNNRSGVKSKASIRDLLPPRDGRNTHPGLHSGVQPTPRKSSQQVQAEHQHQRLELEARLEAAEEAKQMLARMELEDDRIQEAVEEEGQRRLIQLDEKGDTGVVSNQEVIEGLDEVSGDEEDDSESKPDKVEVSLIHEL
jgi:hypothetical protein